MQAGEARQGELYRRFQLGEMLVRPTLHHALLPLADTDSNAGTGQRLQSGERFRQPRGLSLMVAE